MQISKENLKINIVSESKTKGVYSMEPLPTGFGHTIANALRRILLTSIKGAAVTQAKIAGATHQFTTIQGVKEDIVELTLNLKQLRFKSHSDNPIIAVIKKKGAGAVTAKDIEVPSDVTVLNKDQYICTLADSKSEINIELTIETGVGYSPMEKRQTSKIGVIVLDALFSPIISANYTVEPARFGERVDLDKIVLEVETDGSIEPKEAILQASEIVKGYYETIIKWEESTNKTEETIVSKEDNQPKLSEDVAIEELPLQTRTVNALKKQGINTLHELAQKTDEEIADIKNLGEKSVEEIKKLLSKEGLR